MSYPEAQDAIPDVINGTTKVAAGVPNPIKDGMENTQGFIGESGKSQAHNTDLLTHLVEVLPSIILSYVDANTVQASTGLAVPRNSTDSIKVFRKNTSTTNITGSDLDASGPTFAANTDYYIYADATSSGTSVPFVVSTNAAKSSSTIPYRLIGGFATNGSSEVIQDSIWSVYGTRTLQEKVTSSTANTSTTAIIAHDNTLPQDTEGTEVLSRDFFFSGSPGAYLEIEIQFNFSYAAAGRIVAAVFDDGDGSTDAIGGNHQHCPTNNNHRIVDKFKYTPSSAGNRTYSVRVGSDGGGTLVMNGGDSGGAKYGGIIQSFIKIREVINE